MKPIVLYDANIFNFLSIEELRSSINDNDNYLTDDIVKELLDARKQHCNNVNFQKKMDLVFKKDMGLNDQFSLIISHVPIGLGKTYENTRNIINPKISPLLCSVHHFWLPYIYSPSLVTDSNRHLNSELTWRLSNGDINYGDIQNFKNRIRLDEIRRAEESLNDWGLEAKKLIHTWAKRDADVIKKKYKISDSRLIIHMFNLAFIKQQSVTVLTGDMDNIDLFINLMSSILDLYIVYEVLKKYCKCLNLKKDKRIKIKIPISVFAETYENTLKKIKDSRDVITYRICYYRREKDTIPFEKGLPNWLVDFGLNYHGNLDCYVLDKETYDKYPIEYIWYSEPSEDKYIRFDVWKKDNDEFASSMNPIECMPYCKYEGQEVNYPQTLTTFIDPDDLKYKFKKS